MKFRFWLILVGLLFIIGGILWFYLDLPPGSDGQSSAFVVNQGDSVVSISRRLEGNRLIRNRFYFIVVARFLGLHRRLQAGNFQLASSLSTRQVITRLSQNGTTDYWLKIIEGTRAEEFASSADLLNQARSFEGYLFPDSYLLPASYTPAQILETIDRNFQKKFAEAKIGTSTTLSDAQVVTLASILEREARSLPVKQMVAGILLNRLKISMALQVDSTVQYARDTLRHPQEFWQPLSKSDLKISSPYNTYLHPGLPPAPICNPGYDSLSAAFHPTPSNHLYYLTGSDGVMYYARTLEEHNQNVLKYLK